MLIRPNILPNVKENIQSDLDRNLVGTYEPVATITTTKVGTFSMTLRGYPGTLKVDWGDGSAVEVVTLLGTGTNVVVNHTYSLGGSKKVSVHNFGLISYVAANTQNITSALRSFLSKLGSLAYFTLNFNQITEDISELVPVLPNVSSVNLSTCGVVGDISVLSYATTSFNSLSLGQNSLTCPSVFSAPAFTGYTYSFRSALSVASHVDNALISFASGGMHDCSLYLNGTNPARTSASDAAIATLLGNGVTIYVNE